MFKTVFKAYIRRIFACVLILLLSPSAYAQSDLSKEFSTSPNSVIETQIVDQHKFYGLASYYNSARFIHLSDGKLKNVKSGKTVTLGEDDWLAVVGRFNVLAIKANGLSFEITDDEISLRNSEVLAAGKIDIIPKNQLKSHARELDKIRYSHLFFLINWLARALEMTLVFINSFVGSWGLSIILIAVFLKIVMLPLSRLVKKYQDSVSKTQTKLAPRLREIKMNYKGEEAHKHFIAAHKDAGVTTFYGLKPMVGLLVQIPVWIAIFNVLAEMPQIVGHSFLWVNDLAYPDKVASWNKPIPLIGNTLNIMPLIMTVVTIVSTLGFRDKFAQPEILKKQKRNLFFMAAAFLILFYPFPSGMVFYWTLANLLNFFQQILAQRKSQH